MIQRDECGALPGWCAGKELPARFRYLRDLGRPTSASSTRLLEARMAQSASRSDFAIAWLIQGVRRISLVITQDYSFSCTTVPLSECFLERRRKDRVNFVESTCTVTRGDRRSLHLSEAHPPTRLPDPTRRPGSCLLGYAMCSRRGLEPFVLLRIYQQNEISEANFKTRREIR